MRAAFALVLFLVVPAWGDDRSTDPASILAAPKGHPVAEAMLTDAVRLLAAGKLGTFMERHCGDCETKAAQDRWRRYQLANAVRNAPYCLHGDAPGVVEVTRWQGALEEDGKAKAYLRCGGGQHADKQEARLPPPVTVEKRGAGVYKITQSSI